MTEYLAKFKGNSLMNCYIKTYTYKALLSVVIFPFYIFLIYIAVDRGGATFLDVPYLIYSGEVVWWKQAIGWSCLIIGVIRYYPPSWKALRHGSCAIALDGEELVLSGSTRLPVAEITKIEPVSNITKKGVIIHTADGQTHYACSIMTELNQPKVLIERITADLDRLRGEHPNQGEAENT